jgi:hypothetical protein
MHGHRITKLLQFPVDAPLTQGWLEGEWIQEKIYVLGKPLDQVPPFRQAGPAL